jgi:hypothetical protein
MPLEEYAADAEDILTHKVQGSNLKFRQVVSLSRQLLDDNGLPVKSAVYLVDLLFMDGDRYIDHCLYELHFNAIGSGQLHDFAHLITHEGNITHTIIQVAPKPPLRCKEPTVQCRRVKFNEQFGEHEVRIKLKEIYEKATEELGKMGFPHIDTDRQSYRLFFAYYYLGRHIKTTHLKWNPKAVVDEREDFASEEFVDLMAERPDHVRLLDLRVDTVSLYWLQDLINKALDKRLEGKPR